MDTTFIYALINPDTNLIRYIGKSDNPDARFNQHLHEAKCSDNRTYKLDWIRSLLKRNLEPKLEILDKDVPVDNWQSWEIYYIDLYRKYLNITNGSDGGEGGINNPDKISRTLIEYYKDPDVLKQKKQIEKNKYINNPELRKKIGDGVRNSELHKKVMQSEEYRNKMSKLNSGENNPFYNKKHTEESRELISKNHADVSGDKNPAKKPGVGDKISKKLKGRVFSEETKENMRQSKLGTKFSEEARASMKLKRSKYKYQCPDCKNLFNLGIAMTQHNKKCNFNKDKYIKITIF